MTTTEYDNCPICTFSKCIKQWVKCPKCSFYCCRTCTKKYLLEQPTIEPKCMGCKANWDYEFLAENTDESFHNKEYREHRAKITVSMERSLLPATQPYVVIEMNKRVADKEYKELESELKSCRRFMKITFDKLKNYIKILTKYRKLQKEHRTEANKIIIDKIKDKVSCIQKQRDMCNDEIALRKRKQYNIISNLNVEKVEIEKKVSNRFIGHCPQKDCKGYLSTDYICGICKEKACRSCRQVQHNGEECDKDTVETIKLIARDTKGCPNCGVPIFKISGCSQMFCMSCKTPFDWETGKIVHGRIHNPHYYEWQRSTGRIAREVGDVRCGGPVSYSKLIDKLNICDFDRKTANWVTNAYLLSGHIRDVILPHYRIEENITVNRDLRVKYLIGDYTEKRWISEIKRREKKREKNQAVNLVLTMFVDTIDDLIRNIVTCELSEVLVFLLQLDELRKYTCMNLSKIEKRFKNKVPDLDDIWNFTDIGKRRNFNFQVVN